MTLLIILLGIGCFCAAVVLVVCWMAGVDPLHPNSYHDEIDAHDAEIKQHKED